MLPIYPLVKLTGLDNFFFVSLPRSYVCHVFKISDTSREKLLSDENHQHVQMQFKWVRKSSVAAGCKGNTVGAGSAALMSPMNLENYSSLTAVCVQLFCHPLWGAVWQTDMWLKEFHFQYKISRVNWLFQILKARPVKKGTYLLILMIRYWLIRHVHTHTACTSMHTHTNPALWGDQCLEAEGIIISAEFLKA